MKQRLGIAAALLGDPRILLLDEPINGLDPDGVRWIRELLRGLAAKGGTILISSHLMSEMAITADRLVIVARGRLIADTTVDELGHRYARGVVVRSPEAGALARALEAAGGTLAAEPGGGWLVTGLDATAIGRLAGQQGVPLSELMPRGASLEEAYLQLTAESTDHRAGTKEARP
jgi:ABC-2 type transport system ATP-binding protein